MDDLTWMGEHYDELLQQYRDQWVAIKEQRVIAAAEKCDHLKKKIDEMGIEGPVMVIRIADGAWHDLYLETARNPIAITYEGDVAYIYLTPQRYPGMVAWTYVCSDERLQGKIVHLDFDAEGKLVGIEVIPADKLLPSELLAVARRV